MTEILEDSTLNCHRQARLVMARSGVVRWGLVWQACWGEFWHVQVCLGLAGMARPGKARFGQARHGLVRHGRHGKACWGPFRRGSEWSGSAGVVRQGRFGESCCGKVGLGRL